MQRLRQITGALMLLSGVTHTVQFLLFDPSPTNTTAAAGFGFAYLVIGVLLLLPGSLGPWLGAIIGGIGAVLSSLVALGNPDPFALLHAVINWIVFPACIVLIRRRPAASEPAA